MVFLNFCKKIAKTVKKISLRTLKRYRCSGDRTVQINSIQYGQYYQPRMAVKSKRIEQEGGIKEVNFGLHNPQAAYQRALKLKSDYAKMGINYIMPTKTWSDAKIEKMVNRVDYAIKGIMAAGLLSTAKIRQEINKTLPDEDKDFIKILDLEVLPTYLMKQGMSKKDAKSYAEASGGIQMPVGKKFGIFLPIQKYLQNSDNKFDQLNLRMSLAHELTHAYRAKFQNTEASNDYHYEKLDDDFYFEKEVFNQFEQEFYDKFDTDELYDKVKHPSEKDMYKFLKVKNEKALFKEFDAALEKVINENYEDTDSEVFDTKQFYKYCQYRAQDEKHAYKTNKILDEYEEPYGVPIKNDYASDFYGKMEKYFRLKAQKAEEAPETYVS